MGNVRIGISGWRYAPWRGVFYPAGLAQREELAFAGRHFSSIEINGTFYSLQRPETFARWRDEVPDDFVFAIKGGRFLTHSLRLRDIETPLANFLGSGMLALGGKLGPFLWQFPANFRYDADRFARFFELLPGDTAAAGRFAAKHCDERIAGRSCFASDSRQRLRHAVEIRHESFLCEEFVALLRQHNIALVVADAAARWPSCRDVTADFMYLRLHGAEELYASGYDEPALEHWAAAINCWRQGRQPEDAARISSRAPTRRRSRDVYCYFDNDQKVRAPADAQRLMQRLELRWPTQHAA